MNKILTTGLLSLGLLSSCVTYEKIYSEPRHTKGIVIGKLETNDYNSYDSLSNNYAIFIITNIDDKMEGTSCNSKTLHKIVRDSSLVDIIYRDKYYAKYIDGKFVKRKLLGNTFDKITTIGANNEIYTQSYSKK